MATNQTEHYKLNQWKLTDSVVMADFNADNAKIEQALLALKASLPKFQSGSFVVTESHTKDNPFSYTFDFPPKLVLLVQSDEQAANLGPMVLLRGVSTAMCAYDPGNQVDFRPEQMHLTWEGSTVTWYLGYYPFHAATYHFFAIG